MKFVRDKSYKNKVLIIDGLGGCGKTLFSQICSSFERVEIFSFAFEIEFISKIFQFKKIDEDTAKSLIKMFIDHKIYQSMMGRETNFRFKDLSGVFNNPKWFEYIKRIFSEGDKKIPDLIEKNKPILNLTCHNTLFSSDLIFNALGERLVYFEIIRHPLYMVIQQHTNEINLYDDPRDIQLKYLYNGKQLPYYTYDFKEEYFHSNTIDRAILVINHLYKLSKLKRCQIKNKNFLTIPFEKFVLKPEQFLNEMLKLLDTGFGEKTSKILKKHNVPREKIEDGIDLQIYKRYGWQPSLKNSSYENEKKFRLDYIKKNNVSSKCLEIIEKISKEYENDYSWL